MKRLIEYMKRALSIHNLLSKKRNLMPFEGPFLELVGRPEMTGAWIVWGNSGHGKTSFLLALAKHLCNFGRVAYNSMEEGDGESFRLAVERADMDSVSKKFIILVNESIEELNKRLKKHKSPDIIFIDSLQYSQMTYSDYKKLKEDFPDKLFIINSHARGREPEGRVAMRIRYDVPVKIRVEGYRAFAMSRYGGGLPYDIWPEKAAQYHGFEPSNMTML